MDINKVGFDLFLIVPLENIVSTHTHIWMHINVYTDLKCTHILSVVHVRIIAYIYVHIVT